jgi:DNA-binding IclR family transcriptional regulator
LVRLTVIDGNRLTWFAASQGAAPGLLYQPNMNGPVVLHATANGKAWLSTMNEKAAVKLALETGLGKTVSYGPRVIKTIEQLMKDLEQTRKRGYGQSVEEAEQGVNAVAVPVRSLPDERVVGTMSIAGPSQRMSKDKLPELARLLGEAAAKLRLVWPLQQKPL